MTEVMGRLALYSQAIIPSHVQLGYMSRQRVFVASSREKLALAHAVQENLEPEFEVTVWDQGLFSLSQTSLESLLQVHTRFDAAVFVFAADDTIIIRDTQKLAVRDNVVFELGLFVGRLGRDRTFIIIPSGADVHLPTDLIGMTPAEYKTDRSDLNWVAALGPASNQIRRSLQVAAPRDAMPVVRQITVDQRKKLGDALTSLNESVMAHGRKSLDVDVYWVNAGDCAEYARQFVDFFRSIDIRASLYSEGAMAKHLHDDYFYGLAIRWNSAAAAVFGVPDLGDRIAAAMRNVGIEVTTNEHSDYRFIDLIVGARRPLSE